MLKRKAGVATSFLIELIQRDDTNQPASGLNPNLSICKWAIGQNYSVGTNAVKERSNGAYSVALTAAEMTNAGDGLTFRVVDTTSIAVTYRDQIELVTEIPEELMNDLIELVEALPTPGDATLAKQNEILTAIDDLPVGGGGGGITVVNHDYGGSNALQIVDQADDSPIENVNIYFFLKSDYIAGNTGSSNVKGWSMSDVNGQWSWSCYLDPATYYMVLDAPGYEQEEPVEVEVT